MSATLSLTNNFSIETQGRTITGKQGAADSGFDTAYDVTVTGLVLNKVGSLATAAVVLLYDDSAEYPADWTYCMIWADQDTYVQAITAATNAIFKQLAYVPFTLTYNSLLAAASTSAITGGSTPSTADIKKVYLGNYSGSAANYAATFVY